MRWFPFLLLATPAMAHEGHHHGAIEMPKRPEIRTEQDAVREAATGCLRAQQRAGPVSVRLTYSRDEVTVTCPARGAVSVTKTIRF
jgi:hypothetical protein